MPGEISRDSVVVVTEKQVSSEFLDEEVVVLNVQEGAYYVLNPVAARIWSMIQEPRRVSELVGAIMEEYEVADEQGFREVISLLRDLSDRALIHVRDGTR